MALENTTEERLLQTPQMSRPAIKAYPLFLADFSLQNGVGIDVPP